LSWVYDGEMTLVAPIVPGERLEALFSWSNGTTKRLRVEWDAKGAAPDLSMVPEQHSVARPAGDTVAATKICACYQSEGRGSCGAIIANADVACVNTYDSDCRQLLACAEGNPLAPPACPVGSANAGAAMRCQARAGVAPALIVAEARSSAKAPDEVRAAGSGLMAAAQAFVGSDCKLGSEVIELISVVPHDRCATNDALVATYQAALVAFQQRAQRVSLAGEAATFSEKAAEFGEFTRAALKAHDTRGTAALLQDLARAYNAWQPEDRVPVDAPRMLDLYFGLSGDPRTDYFRNLRKDGAARKAAFEKSGKHLVWRRGPNGFEGPYMEGDKRTVGGY